MLMKQKRCVASVSFYSSLIKLIYSKMHVLPLSYLFTSDFRQLKSSDASINTTATFSERLPHAKSELHLSNRSVLQRQDFKTVQYLLSINRFCFSYCKILELRLIVRIKFCRTVSGKGFLGI